MNLKFYTSRIGVLLCMILMCVPTFAQETIKITQNQHEKLLSHFFKYEIGNINDLGISVNQLKTQNDFHQLNVAHDKSTFVLEVHDAGIFKDNFVLSTTAESREPTGAEKPVVLTGRVKGQAESQVKLTLNDEFIYGYFKADSEQIFVEPLYYYLEGVDRNLFIQYNVKDAVLDRLDNFCGAHHVKHKAQELAPATRSVGLCFEVDIALAADFAMFNKHSGFTGTSNHMVAVLNAVQGNYDDEFPDELRFVITEEFISSCNSCDPWTSSTNAGTLLDDFTNWGPIGFIAQHDVATLWTDRNLANGTLGIAWLSAVCTGIRYNVCQDFTGNGELLRVVQAHELGHNFGSGHDGSSDPFIMRPSVVNSSTWSSNSINSITNHYLSRTCLASCPPLHEPPIAGFSFNVQNGCAPAFVQFFDESEHAEDYFWEFPTGFPLSSTEASPLVQFADAGDHFVQLTVTNPAGTDQTSQLISLNLNETPIADFSFVDNNGIVEFTSLTNGQNVLHLWDFGDGNSSSSQDPTHTYATPGLYDVRLYVENECGFSEFVFTIEVKIAPRAEFEAINPDACVGDEVQFQDLTANNPIIWNWALEGGSPSASNQQHPNIVYSNVGVYDVYLFVENETGSDELEKEDYIDISDTAIAAYSYTIDGNQVTFTNSSSYATDGYLWDFGDGNTSTETNPVHTFSGSGPYDIVLMANNSRCGGSQYSESINLSLAPNPDFDASLTQICQNAMVSFQDMSSNAPTAWLWTFEGGNPSTSTDQNPQVMYEDDGTYAVTLEVSNAEGNNILVVDNYITVIPDPEADFSSNINGLEVNFTNLFVADTYFWDFGDGTTSDLANPSHNYVSEGLYTVTCNVSNACDSNQEELLINLYTAPTADFALSSDAGCADFTVMFNNNSSDNAESFLWTFEGGTPAISVSENPTIVYQESGTYNVRLIASNPYFSDTLDWAQAVTVDDVPQADFTFSGQELSYQFQNTTSNGDSYLWDFGDGNTSEEENPMHTYAEEGTRTVTLTATNDCGDAMHSTELNVTVRPTAAFGANSTSGCVPFEVQFTNQSTSSTSYMWTFEGGNPSTSDEENPTVMYDQPGVYDVTLLAMSEIGEDEIVMQDYITIIDVPTSDFGQSIDGNAVSFSDMSEGATSYSWDFGDDLSSNAQNPTHIYGANGTYDVILTSTNACGSMTSTSQVTIDAYPSLSISDDELLTCQFNTLTFDFPFTNTDNYLWTFEGGTPGMSTDPNPTVTYNATGSFDVIVVITNQYGSTTITLDDKVSVSQATVSDFGFSADQDIISFEESATAANAYLWDFGDGNTSTLEDPTHQYNASGEYTVTLTVEGPCGTDVSMETIFVEILRPIVNVGISDISGCEPFTVSFTDNSDNEPSSWYWAFEGGNPATSTAQNPVVTYDVPGTYEVYVEMGNEFGVSATNLSQTIEVLPQPVVDFSYDISGTLVDFNQEAQFADDYMWDFGDGNTSDEENPSHNYAASGTYLASLTVSNDCGEKTKTIEIVVRVSSLNDISFAREIVISPNPGNGLFNIDFDALNAERLEFIVYSTIGQELHKTNLKPTGESFRHSLDLSDFTDGLYILEIRSGEERFVQKLQIVK